VSDAPDSMAAPVASADSGPVSSCPEIADKTLTPDVVNFNVGSSGTLEEMLNPTVAEGTTAPAGIVRIAGEELLEAIESEEDIVKANMELLEGRALTEPEQKRWQRLVSEIQRECNKRLKAKGIVLLAGCPEPNGLGFVLTGCNAAAIEAAERGIAMPSEDYTVTVTLPARERVDIARTEREEFVRRFIDLICAECIEQQRAYQAKQRFFN
jgi:hypothetical protein